MRIAIAALHYVLLGFCILVHGILGALVIGYVLMLFAVLAHTGSANSRQEAETQVTRTME